MKQSLKAIIQRIVLESIFLEKLQKILIYCCKQNTKWIIRVDFLIYCLVESKLSLQKDILVRKETWCFKKNKISFLFITFQDKQVMFLKKSL